MKKSKQKSKRKSKKVNKQISKSLRLKAEAALMSLLPELDRTRDMLERRNHALLVESESTRDPELGIAEITAQLAVFMAWTTFRAMALADVSGTDEAIEWAEKWSMEYVESVLDGDDDDDAPDPDAVGRPS